MFFAGEIVLKILLFLYNRADYFIRRIPMEKTLFPPKSVVTVRDIQIGPGLPLVIMAGPCVAESEELCMRTAEGLAKVMDELGLKWIFKSSYDKANRSAGSSFRGPGIEKGLRILEKVRSTFNVPVVTDVHSAAEAIAAGAVVDLLQIPAFLCRQTDLLEAAAGTRCPISVKKGQFLSPWEMKNVVDKICSSGNDQVICIDRGTMFGYQNLVVDMRSFPIMRQTGAPVCFDATHSVQIPGGLGTCSGGQREFIAPLVRAAAATGIDALYMEVHPNPAEAQCDRETQYPLHLVKSLIELVKQIHELVNNAE
jgi:2-dehydro-3-deoxyphosphooctonate aldolase (KDO 8-P synthase)